MKTPLFMTIAGQLSPKRVEAFPHAKLSHGPGSDLQNVSVTFIDYMGLSSKQKRDWLEAGVLSGSKIIVLSPTPNEAEAVQVIKLGAVGYGHSLAVAVRLKEMESVVSQGGLWLGNQLLKRVMSTLTLIKKDVVNGGNNTRPAPTRREILMSSLSGRQQLVADLVAQGATNPEISVQLNIKERTVKAHITSIYNKLDVRNRVELALLLNNIQFSRHSIGK